jgi:inhibitor of cysteine peptidase
MPHVLKSKVSQLGLKSSFLLFLCIFLIAAAGVKKMNVSLGKEFTISLEANPSTGYTWEANYDADLLKLTDTRFEPSSPKGPPSAQPLGSSGKAVFRFIPIKVGQTTVKMVYQRPWEKSPVQEEVFTVIINEGEGS